jgi:hypothetical protein
MTSSTPTTSPQKRLSVFLRFKKQIWIKSIHKLFKFKCKKTIVNYH